MLPDAQREALIARLEAVREENHDSGRWIAKAFADLAAAYEID